MVEHVLEKSSSHQGGWQTEIGEGEWGMGGDALVTRLALCTTMHHYALALCTTPPPPGIPLSFEFISLR